MSDALPEFEIVNSEGSTDQLEGTTAAIAGDVLSLPAVADKVIESFTLENLAPLDDEFTAINININTEILYSVDGGTKFDVVYAGQSVKLRPKGVKQVVIKSNEANAPYRFKVNYEVFS